MANSHKNCKLDSALIDGVRITPDNLTGRAGLALFSRYVSAIEIMPHIDRLFGSMRKNGKGLSIVRLFKQLLCFFVDGTSPQVVQFDQYKKDRGHAGAIEATPDQMASSHQVKRFFAKFSWVRIWLFRTLLQHLFLWRLKIEQPEVIVLGLDTMVMDNSEAEQREGVQPTYKPGTRGFKPLQLSWGPYIIDAVFRGGKKHCNDGETATKMLEYVIGRIRKSYRAEVPIIIRADSAFFDQDLFGNLERLGVWYLVAGRLYESIKQRAHERDQDRQIYTNGRKQWAYVELWPPHESWDRRRRALYTYTWSEDGQRQFSFETEQIIYTNLDPNAEVASEREQELLAPYLQASMLIALYHGRGSDELVHRALKDFREERLPFKRFSMNAAFYYMALVAFLLFESFKRDVTREVIPVESYATRVRRTLIDIAGKVTRHAHKTVLKVTRAVWERLDFGHLWERANAPPRFAWSR